MQTMEDPSIAAIIGNSPLIIDIKAAIVKLAPRNTTVLVTGETGTGKELIAQAIHQGSLRRFKPFVRVNCAAIPDALLESELFGYAEGSFTGGKKGGYIGKFAEADGGTVFLDEIGDLPFSLQAKLLRFLQEHEIQRIGELTPRRVNVRVVAATNANLQELVQEKKFRSDLYYRLNVVTLELPPLRERQEDILLIARAMIKQLNTEFNYRVYLLSPEVQKTVQNYSWPGNVRELANVLEVAFNLCDGERELQQTHLPKYLQGWAKSAGIRAESHAEALVSEQTKAALPLISTTALPISAEALNVFHEQLALIGYLPLSQVIDGLEDAILRYVLHRESNRSKVAQLLGISRPALYKKMQKYLIT
jgi:transcriptional regulator with PAS, ATPase and Fis domain